MFLKKLHVWIQIFAQIDLEIMRLKQYADTCGRGLRYTVLFLVDVVQSG